MVLHSLLACLRWIFVLLLLAAQVRSAMSADVWQLATSGAKSPIGQEFFGVHVHRLEGVERGPQVRPSPYRAEDPPSMRMWDAGVTWFDINKRPGEFDFSRMDAYVALANQRGARIIYPFGMTPAWASMRPDEPCPYGLACSAPPRSLDDWKAYVRAVLGRYGGKLWMVEVWNEPYFSDFPEDRDQRASFYSGDAQTLVEMTRVIRQAIDELSPSTLLCSPSFVGSAKRLDLYLEKGGSRYIDALCSHLYAQNTKDLARNVLELRAVLARRGMSGLAMLNTESGVATDGPPVDSNAPDESAGRDAAARMAQQVIVTAMSGIESFYYYAWDNDHTGFFASDGSPRPALSAWFAVKRWLTGLQPRGCRESEAYVGVIICRAERAGIQQAWIWHERPGKKELRLRTLWREIGLGRAADSAQALFQEDMEDVTAGVRAGTLRLGASPVALTFRN